MFGKRKLMARVADSLYDSVPFTHPEVVRFGDDDSLRLQSAPNSFLLVSLVGREWVAGDVYIDPATDEPVTDAFSQRLMRDSVLPLRVQGKQDLDGLVMRVMQRLVQQWGMVAQSGMADEAEREWSANALQQLEARMNDPRPPLHP